MKIKLETKLKDSRGKHFKLTPDGAPLSIGEVLQMSLDGAAVPPGPDSLGTKLLRFGLAKRIARAKTGTVDLKSEEVTTCKEAISGMFEASGLVGAACEYLETAKL